MNSDCAYSYKIPIEAQRAGWREGAFLVGFIAYLLIFGYGR
jgi:hypothetical protein